MNSIFKEYIICMFHDILNGFNLNEEEQHLKLIPNEAFVYRNITLDDKIKFNENIDVNLTQDPNITNNMNSKHIKVECVKFNDERFKKFLLNNVSLQAEDGISANQGISNTNNINFELEQRLNEFIKELNSKGIKAEFAQLYYQNDVKKFSNSKTFAVARFNVGFLRECEIEVLCARSKNNKNHVLVVSKELHDYVRDHLIKIANHERSEINILDEPKQKDVYKTLSNYIFDDIKFSSNVNNFYSLFYNVETNEIIKSHNDITYDDLYKHCVFTNFFQRGYIVGNNEKKNFNYSVYYNGIEFIIYKYDHQLDDFIVYNLNNNKVTESFRSFLFHKGILK